MRFRFASILLLSLASFGVFAAPVHATPVSSCAADFSSCQVFEDGLPLVFPFCCAIAGDVILLDPNTHVSDVFRFFNDFVDTGGGTGLGLTAFLYSLDEGNLPLPASFSANAVFINEGPADSTGMTVTNYVGNGTLYVIHSQAVPEPATFGLLTAGLMALKGLRKRSAI